MMAKWFNRLAAYIKDGPWDRSTKLAMADMIVEIGAEFNPNFKKERFYNACGL